MQTSKIWKHGAMLGVLLAFSLPVFAQGNNVSNNCPGNSCHGGNSSVGNVSGGNATANGGNATVGNITNVNSATGGQGGRGGEGGSAAVVGSGNSSNTNLNSNISNNTNTARVNNDNLNVQGQQQGQAQSTDNANNSEQETNVTVEGDEHDYKRIPASSAIAVAPLPSAICRSGKAGALQTGIFGISLGGDHEVETCEINEATRIAAGSIGDKTLALEIFCQNKFVKNTSQCKALVAKQDSAKASDLMVEAAYITPDLKYGMTEDEGFRKTNFLGADLY